MLPQFDISRACTAAVLAGFVCCGSQGRTAVHAGLYNTRTYRRHISIARGSPTPQPSPNRQQSKTRVMPWRVLPCIACLLCRRHKRARNVMQATTVRTNCAAHNSSIEPLLGTHAGVASGYNGNPVAWQRTQRCETCGSTDSSSNLGSCGAVLFTSSAHDSSALHAVRPFCAAGERNHQGCCIGGTSAERRPMCLSGMRHVLIDNVGSDYSAASALGSSNDHGKAMFPVERRCWSLIFKWRFPQGDVIVVQTHQPGHKTRAYPDREADGARRALGRYR